MKYLTAQDISAMLSVPKSSAYEIMRAVGFIRIGKRIRVEESKLKEYLESKCGECTSAIVSTGLRGHHDNGF